MPLTERGRWASTLLDERGRVVFGKQTETGQAVFSISTEDGVDVSYEYTTKQRLYVNRQTEAPMEQLISTERLYTVQTMQRLFIDRVYIYPLLIHIIDSDTPLYIQTVYFTVQINRQLEETFHIKKQLEAVAQIKRQLEATTQIKRLLISDATIARVKKFEVRV